VLEFCEFGSLDGFLKANDINEAKKILIAGDCAEGVLLCVGNAVCVSAVLTVFLFVRQVWCT
jgi:hypothetical protein